MNLEQSLVERHIFCRPHALLTRIPSAGFSNNVTADKSLSAEKRLQDDHHAQAVNTFHWYSSKQNLRNSQRNQQKCLSTG